MTLIISTWSLVSSRIPGNLCRRLISPSENTCESPSNYSTVWVIIYACKLAKISLSALVLWPSEGNGMFFASFFSLHHWWLLHSFSSVWLFKVELEIALNKDTPVTKRWKALKWTACLLPHLFGEAFGDKQNSSSWRSRGLKLNRHQSSRVGLMRAVDPLSESSASRDSILTKQITIWHKAPTATHICLAALNNGAETTRLQSTLRHNKVWH